MPFVLPGDSIRGWPWQAAEGGRHGRCEALARISHYLTAEAREKAAITSLRLLTVLTVLFKYASER